MLDVHSDIDSMIEQQNQLSSLLFYDNNDESTNHFWHTSNFTNPASYQRSPGNTLRPFAALWAISKWAKSEIAQSESVGYFFHCALLSCAAGMGYFLWAIPACALFK
jgi:hypothetical protein